MATFLNKVEHEDGTIDLFFDTLPNPNEMGQAVASVLGPDWRFGVSMEGDAGVVVFPSKVVGVDPVVQQTRPARVRVKRSSGR